MSGKLSVNRSEVCFLTCIPLARICPKTFKTVLFVLLPRKFKAILSLLVDGNETSKYLRKFPVNFHQLTRTHDCQGFTHQIIVVYCIL